MKKKLFCLFSISAVIICIFLYIRHTYLPIYYTSAEYKESSELLDNPYCGFYHLYGYLLSESGNEDVLEWSENILEHDTQQLVLLEINLQNYSDQALTDSALSQLSCILETFSSANKQLILRFLYDWDGTPSGKEPDDKSVILNHMTQTSDIVNTYAEHIFILQGNFSGAYGEMNQTAYGSEEDITQLTMYLAQITDPGIFLAVRTPAQWRTIFKSYDIFSDKDAFSSAFYSRVGLYNDGMLGSIYDLGTYDDTPLSRKDYTEKGTREEELNFQNHLCQYVPNGGEVVCDNVYNDLENAITDLADMHITYLNMDYDKKVLDKWKQTEYQGYNGYEYIQAHLGYRYVLRSSKVAFHSFFNNTADLTFTIENVGFAPAYRAFNCNLILEHQDTKEQVILPVTLDTRRISSGDTVSVTVPIDVRSLEKGSYHLYLSMTDPSTGSTILFANQNTNTNKEPKLGELTVK